MVNPRVRGAGEGKGNDDKGKGKMMSPSDTSKDIPFLLKKYELLEESHWKTLLEIDKRKECWNCFIDVILSPFSRNFWA
nr:hypothetical protein Iba_chr08eCG1770 [Ipomoea batatas]